MLRLSGTELISFGSGPIVQILRQTSQLLVRRTISATPHNSSFSLSFYKITRFRIEKGVKLNFQLTLLVNFFTFNLE
jgi:hypothetical protein